MTDRKTVPHKLREQVLKEFNHKCAICGANNPNLHHIDKNPRNNNLENLLPLCPNCHLTDQHNPTSPIDPAKLKLFRCYKDPTILSSQFQPLFKRLHFLIDLNTNYDLLHDRVNELTDFIKHLAMGEFYARTIRVLLKEDDRLRLTGAGPEVENINKKEEQKYLDKVRVAAPRVIELIMELLRYQSWAKNL